MRSIRAYLLRSLILALLAGTVLTGIFTYFNTLREVNELYDKNMHVLASTLESQLDTLTNLKRDHKGEYALSPSSLKLKGEAEFLIQIWKDGNLYYSSHPAIPFPLQSPDAENAEGIFTHVFKERVWRVYSQNTNQVIIQVAQPQKARAGFVREIALRMLLPVLLQIPLIGLFIWFAVGRSLKSLSDVSRAIKNRTASSLEPISSSRIPHEIHPLVQELNGLLTRLTAALEAQKRFTADAAHELRTPLTAILLQLEIVKRSRTETERNDALDKLSAGIQRSIHLAQQLLLMARLEPESATRPLAPVNISELAESLAGQYAAQATVARINIKFFLKESIVVLGNAEGMRVMINNLIDNAIRYTPAGGKIELHILLENGRPVIEVADDGIGIPLPERSRIFDRFYRVMGTGTFGTGLGLAIVKTIADRHQAVITVGSGLEGKGASFRVVFPNLWRPS